MKEVLEKIYGKNYDIIFVLEELLEPKCNDEKEAYDKLCAELKSEQLELLNKYLHLYAERIFKMQNKRFDAGYKAALKILNNNKK